MHANCERFRKQTSGGEGGLYCGDLLEQTDFIHAVSVHLSLISLLLTQDDTDGICAEMELGIFCSS